MTDVNSGPKRDVTRKRPGIAAPTTVSGAVRLAIDDGRALLEGEDRYVFHYSRWHEAHTPDTCSVCAAGAVMARQFGIEGKTMLAYDFDEAWNRVLWTIDAVREQNFALAFGAMVPGGHRTGDANAFANAVWDALKTHDGDPHSKFRDGVAYAKFLDHLEVATLPAIEHAEAEVSLRRR